MTSNSTKEEQEQVMEAVGLFQDLRLCLRQLDEELRNTKTINRRQAKAVSDKR